MVGKLKVYNTLTREKEEFVPQAAPHVGMYVCGPTVYSDVHLGNARTFMSFDIIYRYLTHLGYKVRYVRNITDVGHLVGDVDEGEDKIAKKARLEKLEPMEIVQRYTNDFHNVMDAFNALPPSIEPTATGHIVEQIELVQKIIDNGLGYVVNGSVYFDVEKYAKTEDYGELSGRKIDELISNTRELDGQTDKKSPLDFALWKKAAPEHIMRWNSPWGEGFPGWHLECSVMSTKYLGDTFDIHGGGMDLKFPHHECEIAQCKGANGGKEQAKYWLHTNMLTVNGTKMSKSLNNSFLPRELFAGDHELLDQGYSPMTVRFFMLQTHYSSTLDFSNEALKAAEKGYKKLMNALRNLSKLTYEEGEINTKLDETINKQLDSLYYGMNDDFNTAKTIASLFNITKQINKFYLGQQLTSAITKDTFDRVRSLFNAFVIDILGLKEEKPENFEHFLGVIINDYKEAKATKNYDKVDKIRADLKQEGILIKDMKDKIDWAWEE